MDSNIDLEVDAHSCCADMLTCRICGDEFKDEYCHMFCCCTNSAKVVCCCTRATWVSIRTFFATLSWIWFFFISLVVVCIVLASLHVSRKVMVMAHTDEAKYAADVVDQVLETTPQMVNSTMNWLWGEDPDPT